MIASRTTVAFGISLLLSLPALARGPEMVSWSTPAGVARLETARHKQAFFELAGQFESQENGAFCGPASATIVLNALRSGKDPATKPEDATRLRPGDADYMPPGRTPLLRRYTQNTF